MKITPWIIIISLGLILFLQIQCHHCPQGIAPRTIKGDSIPIPYPVVIANEIVKIVRDTIYQPVDTAFILQDFYSKIYGFDTIINDSSAFVAFNYMVTQNRLVWVKPKIQNKRKTVIIQNTAVINQEKIRNKYYAGLGIGRSPVSFGLSVNLLMVNKKQNAYSLAYDAINNDFYFTFYWQIKFK